MAGGGGRTLEETPTWAVAVVCFFLVVVSIFIEHIIHLFGQWLKRRHKRALYEALEKIKAELMLMGFISLLLTIMQGPISQICITRSVANTWHPCRSDEETHANTRRKLLWSTGNTRRILAGGSSDKCAEQGKVSFVSYDGIHQLHIFIFVLAVFHILYCISTMALGRAKMSTWKSWEKETRTVEYQFSHDPERFRFARETSFGRRHLNFWSRSTVTLWIVCFFRQFVRSVPKVDYLTLRHGFIMAHLAPQSSSKFDFHKYIKRSLDEDFKVVVGISPLIWFFAILFLLSNTHGTYSYLWLPFIPLIVILLVGTKLQVIITKMGLEIQDRGDVVKGVPVVQPTDNHFWFNRPCLLLLLIHFVLFQNAFQLAFFAWTWYEFGLRSCYHERLEDVIIRISMGVLIQFLCSYVTLPLYALVTQMGSNMKSTIFDERVAAALRKWHNTAKKHIKENKRSGTTTPALSPSRPTTPTSSLSPVHLLRGHYRSELDSPQTSSPPPFYHSDNERYWVEGHDGSPSPVHPNVEDHLEAGRHQREESTTESERELAELPETSAARAHQHEINMEEKPFSFGPRGGYVP